MALTKYSAVIEREGVPAFGVPGTTGKRIGTVVFTDRALSPEEYARIAEAMRRAAEDELRDMRIEDLEVEAAITDAVYGEIMEGGAK